MNKSHLRNSILIGVFGLVLMNIVRAGTPVWTFEPNLGFPPSITVSSSGTATIQYTVTNQSHKSHTLQSKPIQGITPSGCTSPLGYHQSCTLILNVNGSALKGDVIGGPLLCDQGSPFQCYQPSQTNSLAIHLTQQPPIQQYTVTPSAGSNGTISPNVPQVVNSGATINFTATPDVGYGVDQWFVDGGLVQTGGTAYSLNNITSAHTVNVTFGTVTLTPSVSSLALSINCQPASACTTTQNAALTGNPRQITIQNNGLVSATNVSVSALGLPSGTSITNNTCSGILIAGGSCTFMITPGSVASSDLSSSPCTAGTPPVAGTVTITADGGISTQVNAIVLGYGCQYQGGFLYSVDDTTPNTGNIGGKVASLVDQAAPQVPPGVPQPTSIIWSSNGNGSTSADVDYTTILGIDETSTTGSPSPTVPAYPGGTPAYVPCNGNTDGACNTANIVSYYNFNRVAGGSAPTPLNFYAAGLCLATINTYSDWYLPASCEMDAIDGVVGCTPGTQSMREALSFLLGNLFSPTPSTSCSPPSSTDCLTGFYWTSTEDSSNPFNNAYGQFFSVGANGPSNFIKLDPLGVRCTRALTL